MHNHIGCVEFDVLSECECSILCLSIKSMLDSSLYLSFIDQSISFAAFGFGSFFLGALFVGERAMAPRQKVLLSVFVWNGFLGNAIQHMRSMFFSMLF